MPTSCRHPSVRYVAALVAVVLIGIGPSLAVAAPPAAAGAPELRAGGSVDEAWLTGAAPGDYVTLEQGGTPVAVAGNPGRPTRSAR